MSYELRVQIRVLLVGRDLVARCHETKFAWDSPAIVPAFRNEPVTVLFPILDHCEESRLDDTCHRGELESRGLAGSFKPMGKEERETDEMDQDLYVSALHTAQQAHCF